MAHMQEQLKGRYFTVKDSISKLKDQEKERDPLDVTNQAQPPTLGR